MAGWLMAKGSASSATDASPCASRARMARRVGSARAAKVASRRWEGVIECIHNHAVIITRRLWTSSGAGDFSEDRDGEGAALARST